MANFHGVHKKQTTIIVAEDVVFDKYMLLRQIGYVFGCSDETDPAERASLGTY